MSHPSPYQFLPHDVISLIFTYHIHSESSSLTSHTPKCLDFLVTYISALKVLESRYVRVDEYIRMFHGARGSPCLAYLDVSDAGSLTNCTLSYFTRIHEINLAWTEWCPYDASAFAHLSGVLDLAGNRQLTDEALRCMTNARELNLWGTPITGDGFDASQCWRLDVSSTRIMDVAFSQFLHLEELRMESCTNVTSAAFMHLSNIRRIEFTWDANMGESIFEHLRHAQHVRITGMPQISAKALINLHSITLLGLQAIPGDGLHHLHNVERFAVSRVIDNVEQAFQEMPNLRRLECDQLDDHHLKHLGGLTHLSSKRPKFSDAALKCLTNLISLRISHAYRVTDVGLSLLRTLRTVSVHYSSMVHGSFISELPDLESIALYGIRLSNEAIMFVRDEKKCHVRLSLCPNVSSEMFEGCRNVDVTSLE